MKTLNRLVMLATLAFGTVVVSQATEVSYTSAGSTNVYNTWSVNAPAGAFAHSYVVAQVGQAWTSGYQFTDQSWTYIIVNGIQVNVYRNGIDTGTGASWNGDPKPGSATMQAGIAGPPAGQVYLARGDVSGFGNFTTDEKYATLAGGTYYIWHGGGSSGSGFVTATTTVSW